MVNVDDESREYINEGFARRLDRIDPEYANVVIETRPDQMDQFITDVEKISGVSVDRELVSGGMFVPATVPEAAIPQIARMDSVELVHQDQLMAISSIWSVSRDIPFLTSQQDPIRTKLSEVMFSAFTPEDQYLGNVTLDRVEVPRFNFAQLPPGDPAQAAFTFVDRIAGTETDGKKHIPTSKTVSWILDGDVLPNSTDPETKVSILDTGHTPVPEMNGSRSPFLNSRVPGEGPQDMLAHGSWCTNTVAGASSPSFHGDVKGVSPDANYGHIKCLNSFPGVGRTSWILKAMDDSIWWGADVISMSLGGEQQGPVDQDPYSRYIDKFCKENAGDEDGAIFVVAAGNAGPGRYTIGSPGVAPKALTVGSWSMMDSSPAYYSSRGPQGPFYSDDSDEMQADLDAVGADEFVKPDVVAPGGGRESQEKSDSTSELLHQACTGWMEGIYDGIRDARGSMRGTSMATPHVAGLVHRLYDAGLVDTAADIKSVVSERSEVVPYPQADGPSDETVGEKNITVGFGPIRESLWE